jgi:hypothetical protein
MNPRYRHPEQSEGSKGKDPSAPTAWILRFAQDDGIRVFAFFVLFVANPILLLLS